MRLSTNENCIRRPVVSSALDAMFLKRHDLNYESSACDRLSKILSRSEGNSTSFLDAHVNELTTMAFVASRVPELAEGLAEGL